MGKELWKVIPDYPKYKCSSNGRIKSEYSNKCLKTFDNGKGYRKLYLKNEAGKKSFYVHRLVAELFVDNPEGKPCVNHIDNNPSNNTSENLEWCTKKENTAWMIKQGRNKRTEKWLENLHKSQEKIYKPVIAIGILTGNILEFPSVNKVKEYGFEPSCVSNCCNGKRKSHSGYLWEFAQWKA